MYRPKFFSMREMTRSVTAIVKKIPNEPDTVKRKNIMLLIEKTLDPIREMWGSAVTVTSGYRCPTLNTIVGGVANSSHTYGQAADITVGSRDKNWELFMKIWKSDIPFTKLIFESRLKDNQTWLHISYKKDETKRLVYIYEPKTKKYLLQN